MSSGTILCTVHIAKFNQSINVIVKITQPYLFFYLLTTICYNNHCHHIYIIVLITLLNNNINNRQFLIETDSRWQQDNETEDKLKTQSTTTKTIRAGKIENMEWDKNVLMEEVSGYGVDVVNWSELARKYQFWNKIRELGKNDGQIVQGFLKSHDGGRIRKRMKRSAVGETTVPCAVNNREWNNKLNKKILSGEYNIGELILPQQYEKAVLE
ncbi:Hypothetical predicted protein [Paramuricea clavata]|uniref:Uncharacterized protein n=1 Tax=Paramuricea clavata TaxID=317549 RepID=A0A6S7H6C3_PARCT|nr:Hypothetical predicted protein [Paramuricea clavata]